MEPQQGIDETILKASLEDRVPLAALKHLLDQREELDTKQEQKIAEIRKKYQKKMKPLLERGRNPKPEECARVGAYLKSGEKVDVNKVKGKVIDSYWNSVLSNSNVATHVSEKDEKALEYLLDVQLVEEAE